MNEERQHRNQGCINKATHVLLCTQNQETKLSISCNIQADVCFSFQALASVELAIDGVINAIDGCKKENRLIPPSTLTVKFLPWSCCALPVGPPKQWLYVMFITWKSDMLLVPKLIDLHTTCPWMSRVPCWTGWNSNHLWPALGVLCYFLQIPVVVFHHAGKSVWPVGLSLFSTEIQKRHKGILTKHLHFSPIFPPMWIN